MCTLTNDLLFIAYCVMYMEHSNKRLALHLELCPFFGAFCMIGRSQLN